MFDELNSVVKFSFKNIKASGERRVDERSGLKYSEKVDISILKK